MTVAKGFLVPANREGYGLEIGNVSGLWPAIRPAFGAELTKVSMAAIDER
jgi:hypothetical protein